MAFHEPTHKELIDIEKGIIIEEVRKRRAIWDTSHVDNSKRNVTNMLFNQIASIISTSERIITGEFLMKIDK